VPALYTETETIKENENDDCWRDKIFDALNVGNLIVLIHSNDIFQRHYGVTGLKTLLSQCNSPRKHQ